MTDDSDQIRFTNFPKDDRRRWLRWLDGIDIYGASGSPTVKAYLAVLPEALDAEAAPTLRSVLETGEGTVTRHEVIAGNLPALRPGMIFRDRKHVGDLRMDRFAHRPLGPSSAISLIAADAVVQMPSWAKYSWSVLSKADYPLGATSSSFCLRLIQDEHEVLIPASEVFRVFCAPETEIANLILAGEWKNVVGQLLNETFCDKTSSEWQVGLRKGLTARSATILAAYYWTEAGKATRNLLRSGLHERKHGLSARFWTGHRLKATIPYGFDGIELSGEGRDLGKRGETHRFLLLRISSVKFIGLHEITAPINYRLDNYNVQHSTGHRKDESSYVQRPMPIADGSGGSPLDNSNVDPPSSASIGLQLFWEAPKMEGLPKVDRLPLDPRPPPESERRRIYIVREPTGTVSTATPQRGHRDVASLTHHPEQRDSLGFGAVGQVLEALGKSGVIASWMPTVPLDWPWQGISDVQAWKLPPQVDAKRSAFSFLGRGIRRTCLVVEIEIGQEKIHWLELERQQASDRFRYLLLKVEPTDMEAVVGHLITEVTRNRGVWGRVDDGGGAYVMKAFKHVYTKDGILRRDPVRLAIRSILRKAGGGLPEAPSIGSGAKDA